VVDSDRVMLLDHGKIRNFIITSDHRTRRIFLKYCVFAHIEYEDILKERQNVVFTGSHQLTIQ
jgi:hypothetical protein